MTPTVKFNDLNSKTDFEMILEDYTIPPAKKKTHLVSIPGRNGDLDLSDYLGSAYENREISMSFFKKVHISDLNDFQSEIEKTLNGQKMKIVFSNDPDFYWEGRISITDIVKLSIRMVRVTIKLNADPFKTNIKTEEEVL